MSAFEDLDGILAGLDDWQAKRCRVELIELKIEQERTSMATKNAVRAGEMWVSASVCAIIAATFATFDLGWFAAAFACGAAVSTVIAVNRMKGCA